MALGENETDSDDDFLNSEWALDINERSSGDEIENYSAPENWSNTPPTERALNGDVFYEAFPFTGPDPEPTGTPINPLQAFHQFFCDEAIDIILLESNKMRKPKKNRQGIQVLPNAIDKNERMVFIAILILTEIHGKNHLKDNGSTNEYLQTPIFSKLMSLQRWMYIQSILHFQESAQANLVGLDKFGKIRDLYNIFNDRFSSAYNMDQAVSVDEQLILWKGHHSLKRYIPSKADKWGFKFYALAESRTGYIHRLLVDEGARTDVSLAAPYQNLQRPGQYVMHLMSPILSCGHILAVDNFYTEILLFQHLVRMNTSCLGTLRKGRRLLPPEITKHVWKKKAVGKQLVKYNENFFLFTWMDKRDLRFLSSISSPKIINGKPLVIHEYNSGMPGVDLADQKRHSRIIARKRLKRWYKKVFYHLIDVSLVNAHIIITTLPDFIGMSAEKFRQTLVESIISHYWQPALTQNSRHLHSFKRLVERHTDIGTRAKLRCVVCMASGVRKQSIFYCVECDKTLCPSPCFHVYHTQESY